MNAKTHELDRAWEKLQFETANSHHVKAVLKTPSGKQLVRTYRSHGTGSVGELVTAKIRQQMGLNENLFRDAIDCPLTLEGYLKHLLLKRKVTVEDLKEFGYEDAGGAATESGAEVPQDGTAPPAAPSAG